MRIIKTVAEIRTALQPQRIASRTIGFVPTMGALHEGHLSLVRLSRARTDSTVVSIFVNPTQFGPNEDFTAYPRTIEEDTAKLIEQKVDFLFLPPASELYPKGASTYVNVEGITSKFEGEIRPGHFQGVATVVASLFNIVQPHFAFFGQKDAQQIAVITRMVKDLQIPTNIIVGETIREKDGLALSSRNRYLSPTDRIEARSLSMALKATQKACIQNQPLIEAKKAGLDTFSANAPASSLDYLEVVDSETFQPIDSLDAAMATGTSRVTFLIAARIGETRLIDNIVMELPPRKS